MNMYYYNLSLDIYLSKKSIYKLKIKISKKKLINKK